MSTLYVGQRVVCIAKGSWPNFRSFGMAVPEYGKVYTVRALPSGCACCGDAGIYLCEIVNPPFHWNEGLGECGFCSREFRPAVDRKTDISIFKEMLTDDRVPA